jgi:glycosyltransferase involved in cell wall biosynthesis
MISRFRLAAQDAAHPLRVCEYKLMDAAAGTMTTVSATKLAIISTHPIQYYSGWYRALAAHSGLDVHVYYCHQATPAEQARAGFGVEFDWDVPLLSGYRYTFLKNVANLPGHGRFRGFDTPEIKTILRKGEYEAAMILGWNYKSAWQAIRACWHAKIKVLVRSDSHLHTPRSLGKRMLKSMGYRQFIPRFDACLAVGKWSREYFLHYGARPDRIFFVPHAANNEYLRSESKRLKPVRGELREKWGLQKDAVVFVFVGKFVEEKRPMDFVHAIQRAQRSDSKIQGLMIGDGPLRITCEELVRAHQIPVRFAGFLNQSQIATGYVASDALVLPSESETWGLVVNEAMACERPCIVSDRVGCGPDLVIPGKTGAIFPVGDVEALGNAMIALGQDSVELAAMSAEANRKIRDYSVPVAVDGVVRCLNAILNPGALYANAK